ncbi:MAG: hypothetical protein WDN24_05575 [Sphingomonas sp.]
MTSGGCAPRFDANRNGIELAADRIERRDLAIGRLVGFVGNARHAGEIVAQQREYLDAGPGHAEQIIVEFGLARRLSSTCVR